MKKGLNLEFHLCGNLKCESAGLRLSFFSMSGITATIDKRLPGLETKIEEILAICEQFDTKIVTKLLKNSESLLKSFPGINFWDPERHTRARWSNVINEVEDSR